MAIVEADRGLRVARLRHLRLCCAQAKLLATFYESALGFRRVAEEHLSGARTQERLGVPGRSLRITLELGEQRVKLMQFIDYPGRDYPVGSDAADRIFQHLAIVVTDMNAAMEQLSQTPGWKPITHGGPQQLPASSGGVTAFKFRDPEGHPLELLAFPAGQVPARWKHQRATGPFLGVDHSALSVASRERSVAFYQSLGLTLATQSVSCDTAQAALDGLDGPLVEVVAMKPVQPTPHVELLHYCNASTARSLDLRANDVAATCLVFEADRSSIRPGACRGLVHDLVDPDGHCLAIVCPTH
ncbi:MAG: VOC family protein [Rhodanobacter sp.]